MASKSSGTLGTVTLDCSGGGTWSMGYSCTVSWTESYDSMNVLTCSNFSVSFYRSSSGKSGCTCNGETCLHPYNGASLSAKRSITDTSGIFYSVADYTTATAYGSGACGSASIGGTITLQPQSSTTVKPALVSTSSSNSFSFTISNTRSTPQPVAPSFSPNCKPSTTNYNSASFNGGLSYGSCPQGASYSSSYQLKGPDGNVIQSGSGSSFSSGSLQPNTRYTVNFYASNGCLSKSATCSAVTCAGNNLTDINPKSYDTIEVRIVPIIGGGEYVATHKVQVAPCGTENWITAATTSTTVPEVVQITGLTEETCYKVRAVTTTTAGSYTGNTLQTTTPQKGICITEFTSVETGLDANNMAYADVCYTWETLLTPATITINYRVKDGFDDVWLVGDTFVANTDTGSHCFRIEGLFPNQVVYELLSSTHTEQVDWQSDVTEFMTPLVPEVKSDNCQSLTYMTEYLCAAVKKIVSAGQMTVFANPYSQQLCEPGNTMPTQLALWSRYLRLAHAYLCILCDFVNMSNSHEGQYLVGEIGWVNILTEIVETDTTNSWKLATSDAIYKYLHDKLKQVWHYQGSVDVIVENESDLATYTTAASAIVKSENAIYTKVNGSWVKSTTLVPENFGVWHINYDSTEAKAESAWYYWEGTWNNLDADLSDLEEQLKEMEENTANIVYNSFGEQKKIALVGKDYDFSDPSVKNDVIYFVTENQVIEQQTYYTVSFADSDGTIMREEEILKGAVLGAYTPKKDGYTFKGWTRGGQLYDVTLPVTEDMTIFASWEINEVTVSFDIGGASGFTPDSITAEYGSSVALPSDDDFNWEGKIFGGWAWQGVLWSNSTPVWQDMTLDAVWESVILTVAIRDGNGGPDQILHVEYGTTLQPLPTPTRDGYVFTGWQTESGEGFDFSAPITENVVIVAGWEEANVTVTFNAQTLPAGATDTVENPEPVSVVRGNTVAEPTLTTDNYIVNYWTLNGTRYNFDTPVMEDITLDAVWAPIVIVDFDADGGEPEPEQQKLPQGGFATEPENPTKEDCEFTGWSQVPNVTVTFDLGEVGNSYTVAVPEGEKVAQPADPTREGYVFKGWESNGQTYDFDTPVTEDITIVAVWSPVYTVTFDPGYEGAIVTTVEVESGETVAQPTNPVNPDSNCTFEGWQEEVPTPPIDPNNPTLSNLKAAVDTGHPADYYPIGTEIPDTWDGNSNPLIVAQYLDETNNSAYGGAEGAILIRKWVEPAALVFDSNSNLKNYANSSVKNYLDTTYYNDCSNELKNTISNVTVSFFNGTSLANVQAKWFLLSPIEVGSSLGTGQGVFWDYWKQRTGLTALSNNANAGRIMRDRNGSAKNVWTRTSGGLSSDKVFYIDAAGAAQRTGSANSSYGVLPACFIGAGG